MMTPAHYRRAIGWLGSPELRDRCAPPAEAVKRLAGLAACRPHLAPAERDAAAAELDALATRLAAGPDPTDPVLLVEALGALDAGRGSGARAYSAVLAQRIGGARGETAAHPRLLRLRQGCAALGVLPAPSAGDWSAAEMPALDALLAGDAALVARACDRLAGLLEHGVPVGGETLAVLEAIAVSECRRYNVVSAATVLRVLRAAGADDRAARSVQAFVLRQASRHGYFGHPSPFVAEPRAHDPGTFQLPITVAVLCAFAASAQRAMEAAC
jgi:hypothetical protein